MIEFESLGKLNEPFFEEYIRSFSRTLHSGWYILGNNVNDFERAFASYCGTKYCIGVANGLEALFLSLKALNLPKGSEVIVPSNTFIATILAVIQNDLVPVLVEPNITTYNISVSEIEKAISPKTKCIIAVHLYGKCCEMDGIMEICKAKQILLIEDCAQAHGATYKGKKAGSWGHVNAFSFYPTKNLGALGDAGAITTDDESLYKALHAWRNYGSNIKYENVFPGYNSRLDEVQAGFLSVKLKRLDEINRHKRDLASIYFNALSLKALILPIVDADFFDVYHIFTIRHPKRDKMRSYLLSEGVKTEIHYPIAPHKQKALKGYVKGSFPISTEIHATTLSLPISYMHTSKDIEMVADKINNFALKNL